MRLCLSASAKACSNAASCAKHFVRLKKQGLDFCFADVGSAKIQLFGFAALLQLLDQFLVRQTKSTTEDASYILYRCYLEMVALLQTYNTQTKVRDKDPHIEHIQLVPETAGVSHTKHKLSLIRAHPNASMRSGSP